MNRTKSLISKVLTLSALAISLAVIPLTHSIMTSPIEESATAWTGTQTPSVTASYYSQTDGLTGSALKTKLASINNPVSKSYDWARYEAGDEAYNNSSYITCIYTRHDIPKNAHVGSYTWDTWNREHIYTQSAFPNSDTDNHNIFACEGQINNNRGNLKFGEVAHTSANQQTVHGHLTDNYRSGSYFEPCDEAKGEVARAVLYTSLYYGYEISAIFETEALALKWHAQFPVSQREIFRNNAIYPLQGNRNPFVDRPSYANSIYNSSTQYTESDPVGGGFTNVAPNTITLNPSSASIPMGGSVTLSVNVDSGSSSVTWSTNNSAVATVNNGVVTGVNGGTATITATSTLDSSVKGTATITVKSLSTLTLSGTPTTTTYTAGQSFNPAGLTVTAKYSDDSTANVTSSVSWTPSPLTAGTTNVTGSYGGKTVSVSGLIVTAPSIPVDSGTYTIGWGLATGTAGTYSNFDSISGTVSDMLSFSSAQNSGTNLPAYNSESKELRLYYDAGGNGCSVTINPIEGVTFTGFVMTTTSEYSPTVKYSVDGGTATSISPSGTTYTITNLTAATSLKIQNGNTSIKQLRIQTIVLTYSLEGQVAKVVSGLSASYTGGNVYVNNALNQSMLSVTASYTDSATYPNAILSSSDYLLSGFSSSTTGQKTVTVTYSGSLSTSITPMTTTFNVNVIADILNNVTASNTKTYHPGETITKSDITVTLNYASGNSNTTSNFTFASEGYQFTYADANSGGSNTAKQFSIAYEGTPYNFSVNVSRVAYQVISGATISLGSSAFNSSTLSDSIETLSDTSVVIGGVGFTVTTNAYVFSQNSTYYLSFGKTGGSINNTSGFSSDLTAISVVQKDGARTDGVLSISKDGINWVTYSASELAKGGYRFFQYSYVGTASGSGAAAYSNIQSISYTLSGQDNPTNVANYVMYADTNNQCTTKLSETVEKLNSMSVADKNTFWTSDDYVISTARERLLAWARHEGTELTYNAGVFQTSNLMNVSTLNQTNNLLIIVFATSMMCLTLVGGFFFLKKKKEN